MQMPHTLSIPNGEKVQPTFSKEELGARLAKLRRYMAENDLQAVLFTSYHNINYYSDFVYCRFGRDYGLVVTQDTYTTVTANIDGGQPYRRNQLGDNVVYTDWQKDNFFYALKNLVKDGSKIGVEYDHMPLQNLEKMKAAFPSSDFADIGVPTMKMRMIKSDEEIAVIKNGARVADIGGAAIRDAIAVGVPEYEVALAGVQAMVRAIADIYPHGELMDTWVWFQSGINTDGAHNPVTSRKVEAGDILSLNTFPMIAGYYTALERTLFSEFASDRHLELWEINCKVHRRGLELIRPGARCSDIAAELNEIFLQHDVLQYRTFGYGHSFGTLSHYYGREAGLELREDVDTIIEPGMVVSMEPMLMLPEGKAGAGGYREHDILVVGEDSVENITKFPFGPEHNIVKS
ncbi:M24 family metallopeptidase [Amphritea balenae]|uniref:M24 family metallopeptidase n=1 Tax=Amphritea balenae TaxID=452629 RepID=A0A3P1SWX6_9GAMM|nr:M24 family metallopeptidase [Amphritea balenae]RRD01485.1 M24 family metallopeptidase [Amphritea balenae]GGK56702.1 creatinase [Amphritea balenae]